MIPIPFNKPTMTGKELLYIQEAYAGGWLAGNGPFAKRCQGWLEEQLHCQQAFLTHSGTAALEMAAILADIQPGDEIIMPSFTFVATATAFVLRGGVPVFVDIRPDTLNIDETKVEAAITSRTKAIVPVHYAGVACDMDAILAIAQKHNLLVIEDAAHGILASYREKPLGSLGHMAAVSFHETKNIISGEGGALLVNDRRFCDRAEVVAEKGTNRQRFFRGEVDKYSWMDVGSSYYPSELIAAFLWAQMEAAATISDRRMRIWQEYDQAFRLLEKSRAIRCPVIPSECRHNGHIYYLLFSGLEKRQAFLDHARRHGIGAVFHYVPLHNSEAGRRYGRASGELTVTESVSDRLVRLPLWLGIEDYLPEVISRLQEGLR
jgi:dTDP-4-amino-4,6-dideoxygalactose transaminase